MTTLERFKEHMSGYVIGSLGWIFVISYSLFEYIEYGSFSGLIEHLVTERIVYHLVIFLLIPLFMVIGYLFDKKEVMGKHLKKYSMELKQSNKLKDLFIDIMIHDLLNPVGATRNLAEMVLEEEEDLDKKEAFK
ncbi:MAG: hypothetical protein ACE5HY_06345 [Candidatus Hydrothermarchaeales archaeon]